VLIFKISRIKNHSSLTFKVDDLNISDLPFKDIELLREATTGQSRHTSTK